jgi:uncharacterized protein YlxW (UPF0749 family)
MQKPENLGIIVFLGFLLMCLCTFTFWLSLQVWQKDGQFKRQEKNARDAAMILRDERKETEKLLAKIRDLEKELKND